MNKSQVPPHPPQQDHLESQGKGQRQRPTLEEREIKARQQAAKAAQELAKIRTEREKQTRHIKLLLAEIVLATAKKKGHKVLDDILNTASLAGVKITAKPEELQTLYSMAKPQA